MMEIWKDIKEYEGQYQVSNLGNVRNILTGNLLSVYAGRYPQVHLGPKNNQKTVRIHRLVAEAFIPNPNNLPVINHKDENKLNNTVDNLEWCTQKYNVNYSKNSIGKGNENNEKKSGANYNQDSLYGISC